VQMCIPLGNNAFDQIFIESCNSTSWCRNGECVNKTVPNPSCQEGNENFKCPEPGIFPDPFNCRKYHICCPNDKRGITNTESTALNCEKDYGYNAKTTYCDKKLINNQCPSVYPVPLCTSSRHNGP
ncbi:hypothetical protein ILUMI_17688, partial [Ignelater luminosus]